jgi:indole-3-glycerol phosphate synthase
MTDAAERRREARLEWVRERRREGIEGVLKATALALPLPPSLADALRVPRAARAVICEIRRAEGDEALDVGAVAAALERLGATALAVCPDESRSGCSYTDILAAAQASSLPILARDAVLDPVQIVMARAHGAAAVVLEPALVPPQELRALCFQALDLGLEVVIEGASARELDAGLAVRRGSGEASVARVAAVAGSLGETHDMTCYERLAAGVPDASVRLACVGRCGKDVLDQLEALGYDAAIIDASALANGADAAAAERLLGQPRG